MTAKEYVMLITGETDGSLVDALIEKATCFVLAYTNRTTITSNLEYAMRDLAIIAYNRLGTEGESSRHEGGESFTFETAPKAIYDILNRNRLARVGGSYHENPM